MKKNKKIKYIANVVIASVLAIAIAEILSLQFPISAGIVAILSVLGTKRETVKTALHRLMAFCVAICIASICFCLADYTTGAFLLYLILFIPICVSMKWNSAMALDSVLISHFIVFGNMQLESLGNEFALFGIGAGFGILVNMSLHRDLNYVSQLKQETDQLISQALKRMASRINGTKLECYDGSCFERMRMCVAEAMVVANENILNQLLKSDSKDVDYIRMRTLQIDVLFEMYRMVIRMNSVPSTASRLSEYFELVSEQFSEANTVSGLLVRHKEITQEMESLPLPKTRKEFEDRAKLYSILVNMEEFLKLKKNYADKWLK